LLLVFFFFFSFSLCATCCTKTPAKGPTHTLAKKNTHYETSVEEE
jgi:hypothetical protein